MVNIPSAANLSVFIGIDGWGKLSYLRVLWRVKAVLPLWIIYLTSDLATEATTCLRILNSLWIGPLSRGGRFGYFVGLAQIDLR